MIFISSTCKHPIIAIVATKTERRRGNEKIISEASKFIKGRVGKDNRVHLFSKIRTIEIPAINDTIEDRDMKTLAKLKQLLANLGTHCIEKRGVLVPLNWEEYSKFL